MWVRCIVTSDAGRVCRDQRGGRRVKSRESFAGWVAGLPQDRGQRCIGKIQVQAITGVLPGVRRLGRRGSFLAGATFVSIILLVAAGVVSARSARRAGDFEPNLALAADTQRQPGPASRDGLRDDSQPGYGIRDHTYIVITAAGADKR